MEQLDFIESVVLSLDMAMTDAKRRGKNNHEWISSQDKGIILGCEHETEETE